MLGFLYRFLIGSFHIHQWEIHSVSTPYFDVWRRHPAKGIVLKCSKCGAIKEKIVVW